MPWNRVVSVVETLLFIIPLGAVACSRGGAVTATPKRPQATVADSPAPGSPACEQRLLQCEAAAAETSRARSAAESQAAECVAKLQEAQEESVTLRKVVTESAVRIAELSSTPEAKAQALVERFESLSSAAEGQTLRADVDAFLAVHRQTSAGRSLVAMQKRLTTRIRALQEDEARARAMRAVEGLRDALRATSDGDLDVASLFVLKSYMENHGLTYDSILRLPRAGAKQASKDPESERGKAFLLTGKVLQISKDGDFFVGLLGVGGYFSMDTLYYFVTPGGSEGVYEGKRATFAGVFTQRYEYSTRAGGTNEALVVFGYFNEK